MTVEKARQIIPTWANALEMEIDQMIRFKLSDKMERFVRNHMVTVLLIAAMAIEGVIVGSTTAHNVRVETEERLAAEYAAQLEAYKAEQAYQAQAESFLSGDASREAFINQEIDAAAHFIAEEQNETMKGTKLGVAIARLMAGGYGSTLKEVISQSGQWMNYSGPENKFTQADRALAEKMVRDYYENGMIPDGLTADIQWLTWTPGDYLARNNWNATAATITWRYRG